MTDEIRVARVPLRRDAWLHERAAELSYAIYLKLHPEWRDIAPEASHEVVLGWMWELANVWELIESEKE